MDDLNLLVKEDLNLPVKEDLNLPEKEPLHLPLGDIIEETGENRVDNQGNKKSFTTILQFCLVQ